MCLRRPNNHSDALGAKWRDLARDVANLFGHKYDRAVRYLDDLAANKFWADAELKNFNWLSSPPTFGGPLEARFVMHPSVVNALAPALPLRAVFGGNRNV